MGVQITDILVKKEIELSSLRNKTLAVDASNHLYQFLSTIRGIDGSLLTDSRGNVTSHLIGLLSRTTNLMKQGIRLVYVFDGAVPDLKRAETRKRRQIKEEAAEKFLKAEEEGNLEDMRKYASRNSRLTKEMIEEAGKLLKALGVPCVDAPAEGEAQAAGMASRGDCHAVASQDADCLLFRSPLLIRNCSITGRKKLPGKMAYRHVSPELISLKENLEKMGLSQEQLISLAMLVGTDYNRGGIKGIGPKKALELARKHPRPRDLFEAVKWTDHFEVGWEEVFKLISEMPVTEDYELEFGKVDRDEITKLLVEEHDFSQERVEKSIAELLEAEEGRKQKGLGDFA